MSRQGLAEASPAVFAAGQGLGENFAARRLGGGPSTAGDAVRTLLASHPYGSSLGICSDTGGGSDHIFTDHLRADAGPR